MKLSVDGSFELCFERNWDLPLALQLAGKTEGAERTGCWAPLSTHVRCHG